MPVHLDATGRAQCVALARRIAGTPFDVAVHSGFPRTIETLDILLASRGLPRRAMTEFGDVRVGVFEGRPVGEYRRWRRGRSPAARPTGGESRLDALARYRSGVECLLALGDARVLVVIHDVPIRFIANAANGDDPVDGPVGFVANADPRVIDAPALRTAADVMRARLAEDG